MKDKFRPHYRQYHTVNIIFEDMQVAEDAYLQYGAGDGDDGNLADHGLFPFFCVGFSPFVLTVDGLMYTLFVWILMTMTLTALF